MSGPRVVSGAPAPLFERLLDLAPREAGDPPDAVLLRPADLYLSVERSIARLLDTRRPEPLEIAAERTDLTVLDWGVPDLVGTAPGDMRSRELFAQAVRNAIAVFEPRLRGPAVEAHPVPGRRGAVRLAISGVLASGDVVEPVAFELALDPDPDAAREHDGGADP
jgi:type VI secretion system protein ImpF